MSVYICACLPLGYKINLIAFKCTCNHHLAVGAVVFVAAAVVVVMFVQGCRTS